MPKKSKKKVLNKYKRIGVFALVSLFLFFYLVSSLTPQSRFNYEIIPQNYGSAAKYFIYEPATEPSPRMPINISFELMPKEMEKNMLNPITKIELVLSTQLENSSAFIFYDDKMLMPTSAEAANIAGSDIRVYHFSLPTESKTVKAIISGKYPAEYAKNFLYIHAVQRTYFLTEKKDRFLGEQTLAVRF